MAASSPVLMARLLLVLSVALASCGGDRPRNLVLVIGDTLRADKLGCYGNEQGLTPYLDELAAEGVVFENASSHAPWTLPSTASILTSLLPEEHGAGGRLPTFERLAEGIPTLTEVLSARGYRTHAVVNVLFLADSFGLTRGFDTVDAEFYQTNQQVRVAQATTRAALRWLAEYEHEEPFFLLVHYFDPHAVYAPPQPFRERHAAPPDRRQEDWVFGTREQMVALRSGRLRFEPPVIRRAEKLYDGEVAYLDAEIGRLLDQLAVLGLASDSVVAFTADHGEEFLDHGGFEHGHTLYPELTHVPLILRAPGLEPARVAQGVGQIDLAPTLCELLDVPQPTSFVGQSLLSLVGDSSAADRPVLAHGNFWGEPLTSWRSGDLTLIENADGRAELYRWRTDPRYDDDLAQELPEEVERLRAELAAVQKRLRQLRGGAVDLSPRERDLLGGLGYGGGLDEAQQDE